MSVTDPRDIPGFGSEKAIGAHIKPQSNGCWYWDGDKNKRGRIQWNGKSWVAYRLVFCMFNELTHLPRGWHVHHKCQHPGCVNPEHLELLTPLQHVSAHDVIREKCLGDGDHPCSKRSVRNGRCDACARYVDARRQRVKRHGAA